MQLNLDLFDESDPPAAPPLTWEHIDETARRAAIEMLARLIVRMLQDAPVTEPTDE